jgi:hypothetical protein
MTAFSRALLAILPAWRSLVDHRLPLWGFMTRRGSGIGRAQILRAELRCAVCDWQAACRQRLARGRHKPGRRCPNAAILRR